MYSACVYTYSPSKLVCTRAFGFDPFFTHTNMPVKMKIEKYECDVNFGLWQIKMKALITQQRLKKALLRVDKMPITMMEEEKTEINEKTLSFIQLSLSNEIL